MSTLQLNKELFLRATQLIVVSTLLLSAAGQLGHLSKYAELVSHFKAQYLIGSVVCLLSCLFYREPVWAVAAAVGMAINLAAVAPWYGGGKRTLDDGDGLRRVKLILANVNHENTARQRFIAFAQKRNPDALVVQELTEGWRESLRALRRHSRRECADRRIDRFGSSAINC